MSNKMSNKNVKNHSNVNNLNTEDLKEGDNQEKIKSSLGGEFEVDTQQLNSIDSDSKNGENSENKTKNKLDKDFIIEELNQQIAQMQVKFDEDKQKLLLAIADRENTIKRVENDKKEAILFSNQSVLKSLIDPMEYLFLALVQKPDENSSQDYKNIYMGVDMTKTQFIAALEKAGLKRVYPSAGENFNPALHEAISAVEDGELKPNTIKSVVKAGYELNGRVIKPVLVVVVK